MCEGNLLMENKFRNKCKKNVLQSGLGKTRAKGLMWLGQREETEILQVFQL